jgi:hypothetical protein
LTNVKDVSAAGATEDDIRATFGRMVEHSLQVTLEVAR